MPTFTVHEPPLRKNESAADPERFAFVRDGFHFWAFLLQPLWLLACRLWLALLIYVVAYGALSVGLAWLRAPSWAEFLVWLLVGLLLGFEAASIRRSTLIRRGWKPLGFVVGEDREAAERRFFAEWMSRRGGAAPPSPPSPGSEYVAPVRRGPPSGPDVIGLFPEPGGSR
jgi:hypothetical protein